MKVGWKVLRVGWLVGLALAGQLGLGSVTSAEACSGGAPNEGWNGLRVPGGSGQQSIPIATDGFVVLQGFYDYRELDSADPGLTVRVTTDAGVELPGQLRVLRTTKRSDESEVTLGWQADEPLALGSVLSLSVLATDPEQGLAGAGGAADGNATVVLHAQLEVATEPTPLATPTATLGNWVWVRHGIGELSNCISSNDCGSETLLVASLEERLLGVDTRWELAEVPGMVAWEAWAEAASPSRGVEPLVAQPRALIFGQEMPHAIWTGRVAFENDTRSTERCVVLVVRDLRSGEQLRSKSLCVAKHEGAYDVTDHDLSECDEPPTPWSTYLWCQDNENDLRCSAGDPFISGGVAGKNPNTTGGGVAKEEPGKGGAPNDDAVDGGAATSDHPLREIASCGCRLAPEPGTFGGVAVSLCAFGAFVRRRRQARASR